MDWFWESCVVMKIGSDFIKLGAVSFPTSITSLWSSVMLISKLKAFHIFQAREHSDFLCRMKEYMPSRSVFTEGITAALGDHFTVQHTELETALPEDHDDFMPSTKVLTPQDLQDIMSSKEPPTAERIQGWPRWWRWLRVLWHTVIFMPHDVLNLEFKPHSLLSLDFDKPVSQKV